MTDSVPPVSDELLTTFEQSENWRQWPDVMVLVAEIRRLRAAVLAATPAAEPQAGVMHPIDEAFYDLAIKERNYYRQRADRLQRERDAALAAAVPAVDEPTPQPAMEPPADIRWMTTESIGVFARNKKRAEPTPGGEQQ